MKAEEAKRIAEEAIRLTNEAELKALEPLFIEIREAAGTGKTSLTVDKLSNLARKQLIKNGYTIRADSQANEQDLIDWSNPGMAGN